MVTEDPSRFPLSWPLGWTRTPATHRRRARFGIQARGAQDEAAKRFLLSELRLVGAKDVILSTNVELRGDGLPYANRKTPTDPGVAVYFKLRKGQRRAMACDRWDRIADNIHAIALSIEALRGLGRWGSPAMVEAAFSGYRLLSAGEASRRKWWEVLEVEPTCSPDELREAWRKAAARTHPDVNGGDSARFLEAQAAFRDGNQELGIAHVVSGGGGS